MGANTKRNDRPTQTLFQKSQKEELERFATSLNYGEKGMVRVQGIFETPQQQ